MDGPPGPPDDLAAGRLIVDALWLSVLTLLMEAAWIGGIAAVSARAYGPSTLPLLPFAAALSTLGAGYVCARTMLRRRAPDPPPGLHRAWLALFVGSAWSAGVVLLVRHLPAGDAVAWLAGLPGALGEPGRGVSPDLLAMALALFAWWRGQRAGAHSPDFGAVVRAFGLGSILYAAALLAAAIAWPTAGGAAVLNPVLFMGAGLSALSLARFREVRRDAGATGADSRGGVERTWLETTTIPVCAVLAAALGAGLLVGDQTIHAALDEGVGQVGTLLWRALYWPLLAAGYFAELLLFVLRRLGARFQLPETGQARRPLSDLIPEPGLEATGGPPWLSLFRWVLVGLVVLAVVAGFLATSRGVRPATEPAPDVAAGRESLWSWGDLWRAWRRWLAGLRERWLATVTGPAGPRPGRWRDVPDPGAGARALYRRLLTLGRTSGLPRAPAQTPQEYLEAWREALPGTAEAGALTAAYERARYGRRRDAARLSPDLGRVLERLTQQLTRRQSEDGVASTPRDGVDAV